MTQVPLAPPTPTGGPIDGWLYLLWKRVTAAGQILWSSITPSTSADVAAVVTDETGSPGSLVFSGNPTLQGLNVDGLAYVGDTTAVAGQTLLGILSSTNTAVGMTSCFRKSCDTVNGANFFLIKSRGTNTTPTVVSSGDSLGAIAGAGFDGTNYTLSGTIAIQADGSISAGVVPGRIVLTTYDASGVIREALRIDSTQTVTLGGLSTAPALKVTPVASQARWIEVTGATSSANPTLGVSGGILAISASVAITGVVSTSGYTVATLPVGAVGQRAYVTDALAPAYGVAVAGGGAVTIPVFYNGAAWICA